MVSLLAFKFVLAALILVGRAGDILSTRFATPNLVLEANPLARRFFWPVAIASLFLVLVPFYSAALGLFVAVPSLLVASSNLTRAWTMRGVGEAQYLRLIQTAASRLPRGAALASVILGAFFFLVAAGLLAFLSGGPRAWAYWFAMGLAAYAVAMGVYGSAFIWRVYRTLGSSSSQSSERALQPDAPDAGA